MPSWKIIWPKSSTLFCPNKHFFLLMKSWWDLRIPKISSKWLKWVFQSTLYIKVSLKKTRTYFCICYLKTSFMRAWKVEGALSTWKALPSTRNCPHGFWKLFWGCPSPSTSLDSIQILGRIFKKNETHVACPTVLQSSESGTYLVQCFEINTHMARSIFLLYQQYWTRVGTLTRPNMAILQQHSNLSFYLTFLVIRIMTRAYIGRPYPWQQRDCMFLRSH